VDVSRLEGLVLDCVREHTRLGVVSKEAAEILHIPDRSISPRFRPLARKKLIYDSGERRYYKSSVRQIVWKAVPSQRELELEERKANDH
jgi:hypothetical protein